MKDSKGPQFIRFLKPIIEVLRDLDGSGTSSEVTDEVVERMEIPDDELSVILKSGQSRVYNQVHWGRMYLVNAGIIDSSRRGVWTLTEHGNSLNLSQFDAYAVFKAVQEKFQSKKKSTIEDDAKEINDGPDDNDDEPEETTDLLDVLKGLSPHGFERLCQRLLRENGFQQVTVTGKSGDGGIDGIGTLQINKFVSFTVLFQCKRYQKVVSPSYVRDFRGAMEGRADKGIILTTGFFSAQAKQEARRDGAKPIQLVNGDDLVELFQSLELGVKPQVTYVVDHEFFAEYRD